MLLCRKIATLVKATTGSPAFNPGGAKISTPKFGAGLVIVRDYTIATNRASYYGFACKILGDKRPNEMYWNRNQWVLYYNTIICRESRVVVGADHCCPTACTLSLRFNFPLVVYHWKHWRNGLLYIKKQSFAKRILNHITFYTDRTWMMPFVMWKFQYGFN